LIEIGEFLQGSEVQINYHEIFNLLGYSSEEAKKKTESDLMHVWALFGIMWKTGVCPA
jgi:hypothetical protein